MNLPYFKFVHFSVLQRYPPSAQEESKFAEGIPVTNVLLQMSLSLNLQRESWSGSSNLAGGSRKHIQHNIFVTFYLLAQVFPYHVLNRIYWVCNDVFANSASSWNTLIFTQLINISTRFKNL